MIFLLFALYVICVVALVHLLSYGQVTPVKTLQEWAGDQVNDILTEREGADEWR